VKNEYSYCRWNCIIL